MTIIKTSGFANGVDIGVVQAAIGVASDSVVCATYRTPPAVSGLPRITGNQFEGQTWGLDTTGLTGITAYDWRIVGGATQGTSETFAAGPMGQWIECAVTCDQGTLVSPPKLVYMSHMAGHDTDDQRVLNLVPHEAATHIADTTGNWSAPATWQGGVVPGPNARVLISRGATVTYDVDASSVRLDWIRVDGTLQADLTKDVSCLFETLIITRGATFTDGIGGSRRPGNTRSEWIISTRDYRNSTFERSTLDFLGDDDHLIGRGIISQGVRRMWGKERTRWLRTRWKFTLDTALTTDNITSVTVTETIPTSLAQTGHIEVFDNDGTRRVLDYTSWTGKTFTISTTTGDEDFASVNANSGNRVGISFAPMTGDTSLELEESPTGWEAGDTITIVGTNPDINETSQTERRVITGIDGATVSWADALLYDHDHHHALVKRTDLQPAVGNLTSNITIRSEESDVPYWMRGHTMDMHHHCWQDLWDVEHRDLGRTFKEYLDAPGREVSRQSGSTRYYMEYGSTDDTGTMTATTNVKSRYAIHNHECGFGKVNIDTVNGCVVRDGLGWAMVHHSCEARYNRCVIDGFQGGGMIGETGNEIGEWLNNLVVQSRQRCPVFPKNAELNTGTNGNNFRYGVAFGMNGRALKCNGNFAADCSDGFVFFHRGETTANAWITGHGYYPLAHIDLPDLRGVKAKDAFRPKDYPIIHFADNECAGIIYSGFYVTKGNPSQEHGWNVNLKRLKTWATGVGAELEYVVQYAITDFDCVGTDLPGVPSYGVSFGSNVAQMSINRLRSERCVRGISILGGGNNYPDENFDNVNEPKNIIADHVSINDTTAVYNPDDAAITMTLSNPAIVEPSHTLPRKIGTWTGGALGGGSVSGFVTGTLTDTVSSGGSLPKSYDLVGIPTSADASAYPGSCFRYLDANGYYSLSGANILVFPMYFSDRLTGKPLKTWHYIEFTGPTSGLDYHGEYTFGATPPVVSASPLTATVADGGTVSIDILSNVTDADTGTTLIIDPAIPLPDHGRISINGGSIDYTSHGFGWTGTDEFFVFVNDQQGHSTRVDIEVFVK